MPPGLRRAASVFSLASESKSKAAAAAAEAAAEAVAKLKKVEPPPYGKVAVFGDAAYGTYRDNVWVVLPREAAEQEDVSVRMFWATAQPYELKPAKKKKRKAKA